MVTLSVVATQDFDLATLVSLVESPERLSEPKSGSDDQADCQKSFLVHGIASESTSMIISSLARL
jgi:hypothetical protein